MSESKLTTREVVFRCIEGLRFEAEIIKVHKGSVDLRYLDDGNVEERVPVDELERSPSASSTASSCSAESKSQRDTLPRPLAGLVDDDYEERNNFQPVVTIHDNNSPDEAIVLHGAENKLAAGGGLRALRYLKK